MIQSRREVALGQEALELLKRVLQAHLSALGSHEYVRYRFKRHLERQYLTLNDAYGALSNDRGHLNAYDLRAMLQEHRQVPPAEVMQEVDLVLALYGNQHNGEARGLTHWAFIEGMTPQAEGHSAELLKQE